MAELVKGFHHGSLVVADTETALAFYQGILGMALDDSRPDLGYPGAWLNVGEQQIHLLEVPNPDPLEGRPAHGGLDRHLAFYLEDLSLLTEALDKAGVGYTLSRSGRRALFCRDPDQNALEFIEQPGRK
ncbi:MAG: VOC family protein [Sedimenticola sp.]|nr:VOC family protein [Sedimenticola sp.]